MKIDKYFVLYATGLILFVFLLSFYFALSEVDQRLSQKIDDLQKKNIKITDIERKLNRLIDFIEKKNIKIYKEEESLQLILSKADNFIKLYDASIKDDIKKEDGYYSILLGFDYYPNTPEDLFSLLLNLKDEVSPIVMIKKFRIENLNEGTKVYLEVQLIQPFLKGK
ncbi:hypothetical protein [Persephonella sp.]